MASPALCRDARRRPVESRLAQQAAQPRFESALQRLRALPGQGQRQGVAVAVVHQQVEQRRVCIEGPYFLAQALAEGCLLYTSPSPRD